MNIKESLSSFKQEIDLEIGLYLDKAMAEAEKKDPFIADSIRNVKKFILAGGKRLRAALMYYGYIGAGGKEREKIFKTTVSIELVHAFLLIHDDIIDRDLKRHNVETIHYTYTKMGKRIFPRSDYAHFGNSVGIILGDMIGAMGNQIIFDSKLDPTLIIKALSKLQAIVSMTVIGEAEDMYIEYKGEATEKEIMRMYENKTAKYTIEGPLHLGAILAGADDEILKAISKFAVPVGIAFQIQDDILGIFGSEKKIGKFVGSDIQEGKQTILVAKAKEKMNREQKNEFRKIFGVKNISKNDVKIFQKIMVDTGSLEYAENLSRKLVEQGKEQLEKIKFKKEALDFLCGMADYLIQREV
jgi:geranylgeranyl diphosphate synthase, type I